MRDQADLSDEQLVDLVRSGDESAFALLWRRHASAGRTAARQYANLADADDLVSEAYLAILRALRSGGGPRETFRPYLYRTIRNIAFTRARTPSPVPLELVGDLSDDTDLEETTAENTITTQAFRALPSRWQSVLWYTEVEGMEPAEAAPHLGMTPNSVSALAYRAREGLRRAWLQAHVNGADVPVGCRWTTERMGDYVRGALTTRARTRFDQHLAGCDHCSDLLDEVAGLSTRLAMVLLPSVLGLGAATALLAARAASAPVSGATASAPPPSPATTAGAPVAAVVIPLVAVAVLASGWGIASSLAAAAPEPVAAPTAEPEPVIEPETVETPRPDDPTPPPTEAPDPSTVPGPSGAGGTGVPPAPTSPPADTSAAAPHLVVPAGPFTSLPTVSGTAEARATVTVATTGGTVLGSTLARSDGAWALTIADPGVERVDIVARQVDSVGNASIDSAPSAIVLLRPSILTPAPGAVIASTGGATSVEVVFDGIPGAQVQVIIDGVPTGNLHTLTGEPLVRQTLPLPDGAHTIVLRYRDPSTGAVGAGVGLSLTIAP